MDAYWEDIRRCYYVTAYIDFLSFILIANIIGTSQLNQLARGLSQPGNYTKFACSINRVSFIRQKYRRIVDSFSSIGQPEGVVQHPPMTQMVHSTRIGTNFDCPYRETVRYQDLKMGQVVAFYNAATRHCRYQQRLLVLGLYQTWPLVTASPKRRSCSQDKYHAHFHLSFVL